MISKWEQDWHSFNKRGSELLWRVTGPIAPICCREICVITCPFLAISSHSWIWDDIKNGEPFGEHTSGGPVARGIKMLNRLKERVSVFIEKDITVEKRRTTWASFLLSSSLWLFEWLQFEYGTQIDSVVSLVSPAWIENGTRWLFASWVHILSKILAYLSVFKFS